MIQFPTRKSQTFPASLGWGYCFSIICFQMMLEDDPKQSQQMDVVTGPGSRPPR